MALMTAEQRAQVAGGVWSVTSNTGQVVSECTTELEARQESARLSREQASGAPYAVGRFHAAAFHATDQMPAPSYVGPISMRAEDISPEVEDKEYGKTKTERDRNVAVRKGTKSDVHDAE